MSHEPHTFDDSRATSWRKVTEVMAFESKDAVTYHKSWGTERVREGGRVIVPLDLDGRPLDDVYGIDGKAFDDTYGPAPSGKPHHYVKKVEVRAYQPGHLFSVRTVVRDGDGGEHVETEKALGDADSWIVRNPKGEVYAVSDATFRRTHAAVAHRRASPVRRARDQHLARDGLPKRVLALDGGGVRGILTLGYLRRLEAMLRDRHGDADLLLCDYFDLIAGTSTGAILAAGLAIGKTAGELTALYDQLAHRIFDGKRWVPGARARYSVANLQAVLEAQFQQRTLGSASLRTGLMIMTKRLDSGSTWPLTNHPDAPYQWAREGSEVIPNEDYLLRQVVRASTAAPYYFDPKPITIATAPGKAAVVGQFIDGGASPHNNPALLALQLVALHGHGFRWPLGPDRLLVVSLGTGRAAPGRAASRLAAKHAVHALLSVMDDCTEQTELMLQWLSNSVTARPIDRAVGALEHDILGSRPLLTYLRYDVDLDPTALAGLGIAVDPAQAERLPALDDPGNAPLLARIGEAAASAQILAEHLPARFDLG